MFWPIAWPLLKVTLAKGGTLRQLQPAAGRRAREWLAIRLNFGETSSLVRNGQEDASPKMRYCTRQRGKAALAKRGTMPCSHWQDYPPIT